MSVSDAIGRTTAVAPVRRALIADLVAASLLDYEGESLAARLADEIAAVGASDERTALAPALERLRESTFRQRVVATDALADAPLDAALDAIAHLRVSGPVRRSELIIAGDATGSTASTPAPMTPRWSNDPRLARSGRARVRETGEAIALRGHPGGVIARAPSSRASPARVRGSPDGGTSTKKPVTSATRRETVTAASSHTDPGGSHAHTS